MSHCKVFDVQQEIAELKKRINQLEQSVESLRTSLINGDVFGPNIAVAGWPADSFPKSYDSFQVNYKLEVK